MLPFSAQSWLGKGAIGFDVRARALVWLAVAALTQPLGAQQPSAPVNLVLNIPATRLDVWAGDSLTRSYRVAVGSIIYPTPTGFFEITDLTWNPWWIPPPSEWARSETAKRPGPSNPMGRVKIRFDDYLYLHGTGETNSLGRAASHGC